LAQVRSLYDKVGGLREVGPPVYYADFSHEVIGCKFFNIGCQKLLKGC